MYRFNTFILFFSLISSTFAFSQSQGDLAKQTQNPVSEAGLFKLGERKGTFVLAQ